MPMFWHFKCQNWLFKFYEMDPKCIFVSKTYILEKNRGKFLPKFEVDQFWVKAVGRHF